MSIEVNPVAPLFQVENVSYSYEGEVLALDQVSLEVRAGERIAIIGANGCGKSTLLKMMDGLCFPQRGRVLAFGHELSEEAFADDSFNYFFRRRVGLVFQDSDVQLFSPSVWDEVAFAPLQLGLDSHEVEERVERALTALRIGALRGRAPHRLSGGEKKRVALASILSLDPEVWLMDEPTAGLDPRSQSWLVDFIVDQAQMGRTIVTCTHDLGIVETIADRVYVMDEAHRIAAEGEPEAILRDTALLIACNLVYDHRHRHPGEAEAHRHPHVDLLYHEHGRGTPEVQER